MTPQLKLTPEIKGHYAKVFQFRDEVRRARDAMSLPLEDIETLFSLAEMRSAFGNNDDNVMDSVRHVIADTIERRQTDGFQLSIALDLAKLDCAGGWAEVQKRLATDGETNDKFASVTLEEYQYVVALAAGLFDGPSTKNVFISLNYDLVIERAMSRLGLVPDYGTGLLRWNGGQPQGTRIKLLKLHGSINWALIHGENPMVYSKYSDTGVAHPPLLVPPTWNKGSLHNVIRAVWADAVEELATATRIIIIGYSMPETDAHIKFMLGTALAENPGLYSVVVVNALPDDDYLVKRYAHLFRPLVEYGKFSYVGQTNDVLDGTEYRGIRAVTFLRQHGSWGRGAAVRAVGRSG